MALVRRSFIKALDITHHYSKTLTRNIPNLEISCFSSKPTNVNGETSNSLLEKNSLHEPGENNKAMYYISTNNTDSLLKKHLEITGGQVRTRFPPEPNGLLHIGHAKAINLNFGYAQLKDGICFLRYDDTNPEKVEESYAKSIADMISWLGFQPYKVTHASDYFDQLYVWANELIEKDLAYVCHEPQQAFNANNSGKEWPKKTKAESPWRGRPKEESLTEFKKMKEGHYGEGQAVLRLKMTAVNGVVDPVAYRIKTTPHPRTLNKWKIYPTYDYAHCLCDSIENITHSLCSIEFELRRPTYYWICNSLDIYCPVQTEYGRLNMFYIVVSKRKIAELIDHGIVMGWDDPRLYTLEGLRRRGVPPAVINNYCQIFGWRRPSSYVDPAHFEFLLRKTLERTAKRAMAVLRPLKVCIKNFPHEEAQQMKIQDLLKDKSAGSHCVPLDEELWIEETDFKEIADEDFRRLTSTQGVGLKHTPFIIMLEKIVRKEDNSIDYLEVLCHPKSKEKKPKAFIHWVSHPIPCEIRLFNNLFKSKNPTKLEEVPGGFLSDVNPDSLTKVDAVVDQTLANAKVLDRFQFERVGYFAVDTDTTDNKLVLNSIVSLKQNQNF